MQELHRWCQVVHIGSGRLHRVDQAAVLDHTDVDLPLRGNLRLHPKVPLLALAGPVHFRIPLTSFLVGGAGPRSRWHR
jgi:hypothetical protein